MEYKNSSRHQNTCKERGMLEKEIKISNAEKKKTRTTRKKENDRERERTI